MLLQAESAGHLIKAKGFDGKYDAFRSPGVDDEDGSLLEPKFGNGVTSNIDVNICSDFEKFLQLRFRCSGILAYIALGGVFCFFRFALWRLSRTIFGV